MLQKITEYKTYRVAELEPYHKNPRRGNVELIASSLAKNGQFKPIVVNKGGKTGRPYEVLAGNHTLQAAERLGWFEIAGVEVDVDDDEAKRIVAADNRTSDFGSYDDELLLEILEELDDLAGTGYVPEDLETIERAVANAAFVDDFMEGELGEPLEDEVVDLEDPEALKFTVTVEEGFEKEFYAVLAGKAWVVDVAKKVRK